METTRTYCNIHLYICNVNFFFEIYNFLVKIYFNYYSTNFFDNKYFKVRLTNTKNLRKYTLYNRKEDLPHYSCDECRRRYLIHLLANSCYSSPAIPCPLPFCCLQEWSSSWSSFLDDSCAASTATIVKTAF